jgi:hypothetical protein
MPLTGHPGSVRLVNSSRQSLILLHFLCGWLIGKKIRQSTSALVGDLDPYPREFQIQNAIPGSANLTVQSEYSVSVRPTDKTTE